MRFLKSQTRFSLIEVGLAAIFILIVIAGGTYAYNRQNQNEATGASQTGSISTPDDVPEAPEIKSTGDLENAEQTLDNINLESADETSTLDSELDAF